MAPAAYTDGISSPAGAGRPGARLISNTVIAQTIMVPNTHEMTDWVFQWGQFVDHDLDLTGLASPAEPFNIAIPPGDPIFDPMNTGTQIMPFQRSVYVNDGVGIRQQINEITSFLDASMVYGSSQSRADALRTHSGGKLLTGTGELLPLNTLGLPNGTGGGNPADFYVAGDVRANEQVGLTAVHTLFAREHNRLAEEIAAANPLWSDEQIYQHSRKLVGAEIQAITFRDFLPALLGPYAPGVDSVYHPGVDASIVTEFSTALYRVGHTMLPPRLMRVDNDGNEVPSGHIALRDAFFKPNSLADPGELEYILKGLASDEQQEVDMHVIDDVRNFLFGEPLAGGFDLASLNIQRGRDHGLADYNTTRVAYGLAPKMSFLDPGDGSGITSDAALASGLQSVYGTVDDVDLWVGGLSEDHAPGAAVGELIAVGLRDQFIRLRDGDRFWFRNGRNDLGFSPDELAWIDSISLADVIRLNTSITSLQANVFFMVPEPVSVNLWFLVGAWIIVSLRPRRWPSRRFASVL